MKRTHINRLFLAAALVVGLSIPATCETGAIKAQIVNIQTNQPLANCEVIMESSEQKETITTNNQGTILFSNIQASNDISLAVVCKGFMAGTYQDIVVLPGVTTNLYKLALWPNN